MEKVFEDLNLVVDILNNKTDEHFSFIYPFTTENINGYLSEIDVKNKNVLTVAASGDQTLNLLLKGAKNIDTFDINPLTKYYMNLKIAGIKALDYNDFLEYFTFSNDINKSNKHVFNIKLYQKISNYLDKYTKMFWDNLYLELNGLEIRNSNIFIYDEYPYEIMSKLNGYLNEENYYKLKRILYSNDYNINFYNNNILELPEILENKYDLMLLSNISQYLFLIYDDNYEENYKNLIFKLSNNLTNNGKILVGYFYDVNKNDFNKSSSLFKIHKAFRKELDYISFEGVRNDYNNMIIKDIVAVYKKNKIK